LPRFDHRLGGRWLPAGAVHPHPNALRWLGYTYILIKSLLAIAAHHARAQCGWMGVEENICSCLHRQLTHRLLYHSTSACSDNSQLLGPFGTDLHLLSRADHVTKGKGKRQRQLPFARLNCLPACPYYTVTSLAPSCDLDCSPAAISIPLCPDLPSCVFFLACSALPMLHPRTRLLPCDDEEDVGLCARKHSHSHSHL